MANSCPVASTCGSTQRSVFYTDPGVTTATPHSVYGNQHSVSNPEWVNNSRTLVFGGFGRQVAIDDLDAGDYNSRPWMVPNGDMGDGELTRDGTKLAVTSDYGANLKLTFFAVTEPEPAYPEFACEMTNPDPKFHDPSWAPDNAGIALRIEQGHRGLALHAVRAGALRRAERQHPEPDRDGARLGPRRAARVRLQGAARPADPPPAVDPAPQPAPKASIALTKTTKKALRKGLAVKVTVPGAGKVKLVATAKGKKLASGTATAKQAGRRDREARQGAQERQDSHPQVDVQQRDDDVVSEGALTRRLRRNVRDLGREAGERDVDPLP